MFYSHDILTSRKHGVATVWLVATIGAKSSLKKVNRKAILEVNVQKACETIITPEAPMALRLQSNLLYGVSRVYFEQCGYVLSDAQNTRNNMLQMLKAVNAAQLNMEVGKTIRLVNLTLYDFPHADKDLRPEQLILADDPAYLPDLEFVLPDLSILDYHTDVSSHVESVLSPHSRRSSRSSHGSIPPIVIPSSASGGVGGFDVMLSGSRFDDGFGRLSEMPDDPLLQISRDDGFLPDAGFEFDDEGNLRDYEFPDPAAGVPTSAQPIRPRAASDVSAVAPVRGEYEPAQQQSPNFESLHTDFEIPPIDEDMAIPSADQYTNEMPAQITQQSILHGSPAEESQVVQQDSSSFAEVHMERQRRSRKVIISDVRAELRNSDIQAWGDNYLFNMKEARTQKGRAKIPTQAKRYVEHLFQRGLGELGQTLGQSTMINPLDFCYGSKLLDFLRGVDQSRKRERDETDVEADERRVRPRSGSEERARADVAAIPAHDDDGFEMRGDDADLEIGRNAPGDLLQDLSTVMPWNISAASSLSRHRNSVLPPLGGSISSAIPLPGSFGALQRRGSRLVSASPLIGRGVPLPDRLSVGRASSVMNGLDHAVMGSSQDDFTFGDLGAETILEDGNNTQFELFGPAANVDTQTAIDPQWVRQALELESHNFFEFVEQAITEKGFEIDTSTGNKQIGISFPSLLPPQSNSHVVAAQGLLHMLTLATKRMLWVQQQDGGDIIMGIATAV